MRYWEDMDSKWGFGDGEAVPPDAEAARGVYLKVVNTIAEEMGSAYRVVAYDRPGMHNWCLFLRVPVGQAVEDFNWALPEVSDDALLAAIQMAHELDLDSFVEVKVTVDEAGLDDLLTNLDIE